MGDLALILIIAIILFGVAFVRNAIIWGLIILAVLGIIGGIYSAYEDGEDARKKKRRERAIKEEESRIMMEKARKEQAEKEAKDRAEREAKYAKSWRNWENWEKKFVAPLNEKKYVPKFIVALWRLLWRIIRLIVMCFTSLRYAFWAFLALLWAFAIWMLIYFAQEGTLFA